MTDRMAQIAASASAANAAVGDMIEVLRDGEITPFSNVGSGETLTALADALRLFLEATDDASDDANQLQGSLARFLEGRV